MNKASGGDEIPVELFQILKDEQEGGQMGKVMAKVVTSVLLAKLAGKII